MPCMNFSQIFRTLLLADFEGDTIDSRILIDRDLASQKQALENSELDKVSFEVFDKVIEKTIAWGYPAILLLRQPEVKPSFTMNTCTILIPHYEGSTRYCIGSRNTTGNRRRASIGIFPPRTLQRRTQYLRTYSPRVESTVRTIRRYDRQTDVIVELRYVLPI